MRHQSGQTVNYCIRIVIMLLTICNIQAAPPPKGSLSPGPFGPLQDLAPPTAGTTTTTEKVYVPPDIKYWAYGKVNTTIVDGGGLPWYCYTYRQTHCRPLFKLPANWRTTRRPFTRSGSPKARSTTSPPR